MEEFIRSGIGYNTRPSLNEVSTELGANMDWVTIHQSTEKGGRKFAFKLISGSLR